MTPFRWAPEENVLLMAERGVSFEDVTVAVEAGGLIEVMEHPNATRCPRQRIMIVAVGGYAHLVPYVEEENHFFLKTVIPSRKATRDLLSKEPDDV